MKLSCSKAEEIKGLRWKQVWSNKKKLIYNSVLVMQCKHWKRWKKEHRGDTKNPYKKPRWCQRFRLSVMQTMVWYHTDTLHWQEVRRAAAPWQHNTVKLNFNLPNQSVCLSVPLQVTPGSWSVDKNLRYWSEGIERVLLRSFWLCFYSQAYHVVCVIFTHSWF